MGTRPTPDGKPLNEDDQRLMNDFIAVMEKARARRRELIHERREQPAYIGTKHQGTAVIYRPIGGDWNYDPGTWVQLADGKWVQKEHAVEWIEVEENRFVQKEHEEELRVLERALLPLAKRARTHGQQLFSLFRPDLHQNRPLAPGVFAKNVGGWMESEDDVWEPVYTWSARLRDNTHDRTTSISEIQRAGHTLKENWNAFSKPVPEASQIEEVIGPKTNATRERGANSIVEALDELFGDGASERTVSRALERSNERAKHVPSLDEAGKPCIVVNESIEEGRTVQQENLRRWFQEAGLRFAAWADDPVVSNQLV